MNISCGNLEFQIHEKIKNKIKIAERIINGLVRINDPTPSLAPSTRGKGVR